MAVGGEADKKDEEARPLLDNVENLENGGNPTDEPAPLESNPIWMFVHFLGFFIGGTTFIAGTALYFYPDLPAGGEWSGGLYTFGSCGFLTVDVMEFFTFTKDQTLRLNISMSMIGSTFYVIGSIGFFPEVYNVTAVVGIWGFILGSFFIGCSQLWKTHRIGSNKEGFALSNLFASLDSGTQVGVELSAGIGGWCFFVGTIMYLHGPLDGPYYLSILIIWMAGSCFFSLGSLFLAYRHGVMRV